MQLRRYKWLILKTPFLFIPVAGSWSLVSESGAKVGAPPLWISPVVLLLCFALGSFIRASSRTPSWSKWQLWLANPFCYVFKPWEREGYYHPPLFHLGAVSFGMGGLTMLVFAASAHHAMIGHGATLLAIGSGCWLGVRWKDLFRAPEVDSELPQDRRR